MTTSNPLDPNIGNSGINSPASGVGKETVTSFMEGFFSDLQLKEMSQLGINWATLESPTFSDTLSPVDFELSQLLNLHPTLPQPSSSANLKDLTLKADPTVLNSFIQQLPPEVATKVSQAIAGKTSDPAINELAAGIQAYAALYQGVMAASMISPPPGKQPGLFGTVTNDPFVATQSVKAGIEGMAFAPTTAAPTMSTETAETTAEADTATASPFYTTFSASAKTGETATIASPPPLTLPQSAITAAGNAAQVTAALTLSAGKVINELNPSGGQSILNFLGQMSKDLLSYQNAMLNVQASNAELSQKFTQAGQLNTWAQLSAQQQVLFNDFVDLQNQINYQKWLTNLIGGLLGALAGLLIIVATIITIVTFGTAGPAMISGIIALFSAGAGLAVGAGNMIAQAAGAPNMGSAIENAMKSAGMTNEQLLAVSATIIAISVILAIASGGALSGISSSASGVMNGVLASVASVSAVGSTIAMEMAAQTFMDSVTQQLINNGVSSSQAASDAQAILAVITALTILASLGIGMRQQIGSFVSKIASKAMTALKSAGTETAADVAQAAASITEDLAEHSGTLAAQADDVAGAATGRTASNATAAITQTAQVAESATTATAGTVASTVAAGLDEVAEVAGTAASAAAGAGAGGATGGATGSATSTAAGGVTGATSTAAATATATAVSASAATIAKQAASTVQTVSRQLIEFAARNGQALSSVVTSIGQIMQGIVSIAQGQVLMAQANITEAQAVLDEMQILCDTFSKTMNAAASFTTSAIEQASENVSAVQPIFSQIVNSLSQAVAAITSNSASNLQTMISGAATPSKSTSSTSSSTSQPVSSTAPISPSAQPTKTEQEKLVSDMAGLVGQVQNTIATNNTASTVGVSSSKAQMNASPQAKQQIALAQLLTVLADKIGDMFSSQGCDPRLSKRLGKEVAPQLLKAILNGRTSEDGNPDMDRPMFVLLSTMMKDGPMAFSPASEQQNQIANDAAKDPDLSSFMSKIKGLMNPSGEVSPRDFAKLVTDLCQGVTEIGEQGKVEHPLAAPNALLDLVAGEGTTTRLAIMMGLDSTADLSPALLSMLKQEENPFEQFARYSPA